MMVKSGLIFAMTLLAMWPTDRAIAETAETAAMRFHPQRGINLEIWTEWLSVEDMVTRPHFLNIYPDWRRNVSLAELSALRTAGFDFARLPFDPAPLLRLGPGPAQDHLIAQIVQTAQQVQAVGLKVIVDMHAMQNPNEPWGVDSYFADPALFDTYVAMTAKLAEALQDLDPDRTAFEMMNEPTLDCDEIFGGVLPPRWPGLLARLHDAARTGAPDLPLVLSGGCWGGVEGLAALDPATLQDDNILWSFHSYEPFLFSHQGAPWTSELNSAISHLPFPPEQIPEAKLQSLAWQATDTAVAMGLTSIPAPTHENYLTALRDYRAAGEDLATLPYRLATDWADAHEIPRQRLLLGEFGAHRNDVGKPGADDADRYRFYKAKRDAAESLGIGWAVWVWSGDFGIARSEGGHDLDPDVCVALGLGPCP